MSTSIEEELNSLEESNDPSIAKYKLALKNLGKAIKSAHKSSEGKKLSSEYWTNILSMLKKAKLGVSMMELGIDDEEEIKDLRKTSNDNKGSGDGESEEEAPAPEGDGGGEEEAPAPEGDGASEEAPVPDSESEEEKPNDKDTENDDEISTNPNPEAYRESVNEKSQSKSQQRLFGMVHAYNKGELNKSDVDSELFSKIKKIAGGMTDKDAKKMAKTKHDDLPEKVPTDEYNDTLNHLSILLAEENFDKIEGTGNGFIVETNGRTHTIVFDQDFYLKSDLYNFDLGDTQDLKEVVNTFISLSNLTEEKLKKEYQESL